MILLNIIRHKDINWIDIRHIRDNVLCSTSIWGLNLWNLLLIWKKSLCRNDSINAFETEIIILDCLVDPKYNHGCSNRRKAVGGFMDRIGRGPVIMQTATWTVQPQAKESQQPPGARTGRQWILPQSLQGKQGHAATLISAQWTWFLTSRMWEKKYLLCKPPSLCSESRHRKGMYSTQCLWTWALYSSVYVWQLTTLCNSENWANYGFLCSSGFSFYIVQGFLFVITISTHLIELYEN